MNKVIVRLDDHGKGSVAIDDNELEMTLGLKVEAWANSLTLVTITMVADVDMEMPAEIRTHSVNQKYLKEWAQNGIDSAVENPAKR